MSVLLIIGLVFASIFAYAACSAYLYQRLVWYFNERRSSDPEFAAGWACLFIPVGLAILMAQSVLYKTAIDHTVGIPPRSVRNAEKVKQQEKKIKQLEKELGYHE